MSSRSASKNEEYGRTGDRDATEGRVCISLEGLKPQFLGDVIRVGARGDGGYVVNQRAVLRSQCLMSFGVNDDWSFELDFVNRKPDVKVFCFDHSVSKSIFRKKMLDALNEVLSPKFAFLVLSLKLSRMRQQLSQLKHWTKTYFGFSRFVAKENIRVFMRGISNERTTQFVTFADAFRLISGDDVPDNSVFVKMDIEQSEFRVLPDLLKMERCINGLVIEFHDLDILWDKFVEITDQLKTHFEITHIHGNNFAGFIPNSRAPKVLEITFLKRNLIHEPPTDQTITYPIPGLDYPNNRQEKDYPLFF